MRPVVPFSAALLFASLLGLPGCGGHGEPATRATPSPTLHPSTPASADGGSYVTPQEVAAKAGSTLPCATFSVTENPLNAHAQIACDDGRVIIRIYEDRAQLEDAVSLLRLAGGNLLIGQNWSVNVDDAAMLSSARTRLGGEVRQYPGPTPS